MPVSRVTIGLSDGGQLIRSLFNELPEDESTGLLQFEVADAASDADIFPSQLTTLDVLYIESDQAVTYELDGADTRITLDANGFALHWGTSITALTISNSSGSTANIKLYASGT